MIDQGAREGHLPNRELTSAEYLHLKKQIYYFTPYVRGIYNIIANEKDNEAKTITPLALEKLKDIAIYYASVLVFGRYNLNKEQSLIDGLNQTITIPEEILKERLAEDVGFFSDKSDGRVEDYLFGSLPADQIDLVDLPGGPRYFQKSHGGLVTAGPVSARRVATNVSNYLKENGEGLPVTVFGNVARGIIDAACLYVGLKELGVESSYHFYRASSHARNDKDPVIVYENLNQQSWGVAVDSMTAKGPSAPLSVKMLEDLGMRKKSIFLTYSGTMWEDCLRVQYCENRHNGFATLLEADINSVQSYFPSVKAPAQ